MTQETYDALTDEERALVDELGMDEFDDDVAFIHCEYCGCLMIEGTEKYNSRIGILCDCCYNDLFG